mgnify:CR=1 FL=1
MAEWLKAHAWKACKGETLSWVRIPFSPPYKFHKIIKIRFILNFYGIGFTISKKIVQWINLKFTV